MNKYQHALKSNRKIFRYKNNGDFLTKNIGNNYLLLLSVSMAISIESAQTWATSLAPKEFLLYQF